jgi:sporulation integral membrane protein YtvI
MIEQRGIKGDKMNSLIKYLKLLANILFAVLVFLAIFYLGPKVLSFFMPFVIGWLISMIANPLVRMLEKRLKIVRKHSSMMIIILVLVVIVGGGYLLISKAVVESVNFVEQIEPMYEELSAQFQEVGDKLQVLYDRLPGNIQDSLMSLQKDAAAYIGGVVSKIGKPTVDFAKNLPSLLIGIIFTVLSSYFFIAQREEILAFGRSKTPKGIQEKWIVIYNNFKNIVGGYFKAQFKIMVVIAVILFIGLLILKVDFAILLAIVISFLDALPFFGTGTALVPWAVFEMLAGNYKTAIGLLIIYGISQLVRQLIQPKIVGDTIGINPLVALIYMFIGYRMSGVLGMIIAVPIGMIIMNLYKIGVFDDIIHSFQIVVEDFNTFRKAAPSRKKAEVLTEESDKESERENTSSDSDLTRGQKRK